MKDLNNSEFVIASQSFNLMVSDENKKQNNISKIENVISENKTATSDEGIKIEENKVSSTNEIEYKPTTLPKAGSTIYFLILPIGGILILIYCIIKKKDENF